MPHTRRSFAATLLALVLVAAPAPASAQDLDDFGAFIALTFTPLGGFAPMPPPVSAARGSAFVFRYGTIDFGEGSSSLHNFSLGGDLAMGTGRLGLTIGGTTCDGCDGNIMAGLDYTAMLTQNVVSVALRPAFGFSKPLEDDGTALTLGVSLPVGVELSGATGPVFMPYLVPGIGYGRISDDEDSNSAMRPTLGGGFAISGRQSTFAVHLGFQKVFVEDGEMLFGLGFSIGRSTR